jgi:hypothetical protein
MSLDQTYTIDFNNLSFYDGDFTKYEGFREVISDRGGSVCLDEEWISFNPAGNDDVCIVIEYTLNLSGYFDECPGDYWTPPASDFCLDEAEVSISRFLIDDIEVEISSEMERFLEGIVEKQIGM